MELPVFYTEDKETIPKSFGMFPEESPFIHAPFLTKLLIEKAERQILPVIYKDENELFFICVKGKKGFYLTGPACTKKMDFVRLHSFYKCYGITRKEEKYPLRTTLSRIAAFAAVIYEIENGMAGDIDAILRANNLAKENITRQEINGAALEMQNVYEEICHHTYLEECYIMECIREGRPEDAKDRINTPVGNTGILSLKEKNHYKNLAIATVALSTREAIKGGVSPASAYQLSDIYINRIDLCTDIDELEGYSRKIVYEFARLVAETKKKRGCLSIRNSAGTILKNIIMTKFILKILQMQLGSARGISPEYFVKIWA